MSHGREARYHQWLDAYDAAVRRLAASVERDPARRQDLVQDIWLALWQALPRFRGECAERTFVLRVAHNRAVNHIQHWRRRPTTSLEEADPVPDGGVDPERLASQAQRRERLQAAVAQLPLGLRQVVVLVLEGLSHREIADIVGISEINVAVRLTRARQSLAARLGGDGAQA